MEQYQADFYKTLVERVALHNKVILEIGCGNGSIVKQLANDYPSAFVYGIEPGLDTWWNTTASSGERYSILDGDGEDIQFPDGFFDVIYTLTTFEHIKNPEKCLSEAKRVLKDGGEFYTFFAGIWTSVIGHHWHHWVYDDAKKMPPWAHLYMSYEEMHDYLINNGETPELAREICEFVYNSDVLNRIDCRRHESAILSCGMEVLGYSKSYVKSRLAVIAGEDGDELTDEIRFKMNGRYTDEELYTCGMYAHLRKNELFVKTSKAKQLTYKCRILIGKLKRIAKQLLGSRNVG